MVKEQALELLPVCTLALLLLATQPWEGPCLPASRFLHLQNGVTAMPFLWAGWRGEEEPPV